VHVIVCDISIYIHIHIYIYICIYIYMVREGAGPLLADVSACHSS